MSDQNDNTYLRRKVDGAPTARFRLAMPAIPAGHDIAVIVPGARLRQPTSNPPRIVTLAMSVPGAGKPKNKIMPTVNGPAVRAGSGTSAYTFSTPAAQGRMAGPRGPWKDWLAQLGIRVNDGHKASDANRAYIYDLFADVYCCARPTASLGTTPATPISGTSYPEINAVFTALVEDWQDNGGAPARTELAYEVRLFNGAQYLAGGFSPDTSPAIWSTQGLTAPLDYIDGSTPSWEQVDEVPDSALPNDTYRVYARARRHFDSAQFGAWSYITIALNVSPCPPPLLTATLDDAGQRVVLAATPQTQTGAASPLTTIERSEDGGVTWEAVRGATLAAGSFGVGMTVYDYEAARATAIRYRANTVASFNDVQLVSDYRTTVMVGTLGRAAWNLKCPLDPSLNLLDVSVNADPEWTQNEEAATFRPVGRKFPVVVSMSVGGADGSMAISARTAAEWAAVEKLRDYAGALLLESPYGWSRYIRILARSWTETGAPEAARRRVTCSFLEVGAP